MKKLTDINILKSKVMPSIEIVMEFDGNIELTEIINPIIESPLGVASRLEHLAGMIREYCSNRQPDNE